MHERMLAYHDKNIKEYFGLSFLEFIDQPSYRVEMMLKLATKWLKKSIADQEGILRNLDNKDNKA